MFWKERAVTRDWEVTVIGHGVPGDTRSSTRICEGQRERLQGLWALDLHEGLCPCTWGPWICPWRPTSPKGANRPGGKTTADDSPASWNESGNFIYQKFSMVFYFFLSFFFFFPF